MQTAIIRASVDELRKKLEAFRMGDLIVQAKVVACARMPGCIAVQHPRLSAMSSDELYDICRLVQIPLVRVLDVRPLP